MSHKTPFLNLHQWELQDKFNLDDFNDDNKKIDEYSKELTDKVSTHIQDQGKHVGEDMAKSINCHIGNEDIHIKKEKVDQLNDLITTHTSNDALHRLPKELDEVNCKIKTHISDKSAHHIDSKIDKVKLSISTHVKDNNIHVNPTKMANIESHVNNEKIHTNESTVSEINKHLLNSSIHVDPSKLDNPFYCVGTYTGNGNDEQFISLPFSPSFVIVFCRGSVIIDSVKDRNIIVIFSGLCSKQSYTKGLLPASNGFKALYSDNLRGTGCLKHLNANGKIYDYIAFR